MSSKVNTAPDGPQKLGLAAKVRARVLRWVMNERRRSRFYIEIIRRIEPEASRDRVAQLLAERWTQLARIEGGVTGAFGLVGIPLNLLLFSYAQFALIVAIAEVYGVTPEDSAGEEAILTTLREVQGFHQLVRTGPRIMAAIAKRLARHRGLAFMGRTVPLISAPLSAQLNASDMADVGRVAMRRFGKIVPIQSKTD